MFNELQEYVSAGNREDHGERTKHCQMQGRRVYCFGPNKGPLMDEKTSDAVVDFIYHSDPRCPGNHYDNDYGFNGYCRLEKELSALWQGTESSLNDCGV